MSIRVANVVVPGMANLPHLFPPETRCYGIAPDVPASPIAGNIDILPPTENYVRAFRNFSPLSKFRNEFAGVIHVLSVVKLFLLALFLIEYQMDLDGFG